MIQSWQCQLTKINREYLRLKWYLFEIKDQHQHSKWSSFYAYVNNDDAMTTYINIFWSSFRIKALGMLSNVKGVMLYSKVGQCTRHFLQQCWDI